MTLLDACEFLKVSKSHRIEVIVGNVGLTETSNNSCMFLRSPGISSSSKYLTSTSELIAFFSTNLEPVAQLLHL
jgi:hypothetical protein